MEPVNLTKYLANAGAASRRHSAELIKSGHVTVNGEVCMDPSTRVSDQDTIILDGEPVVNGAPFVYVMLHKPRGYVCTLDDPHAPKKAIDLITMQNAPRLVSAGRLDKNSEGLILFSNDGQWIERLTHPSHGITKTYQVTTEEPLSPDAIALLTSDGVVDEGEQLRAIAIHEQVPCRYLFLLGEGKNREIRRMMDATGNEIHRLKRVAVGMLRLGSLPMGQWRTLTAEEAQQALIPDENFSAAKAFPTTMGEPEPAFSAGTEEQNEYQADPSASYYEQMSLAPLSEFGREDEEGEQTEDGERRPFRKFGRSFDRQPRRRVRWIEEYNCPPPPPAPVQSAPASASDEVENQVDSQSASEADNTSELDTAVTESKKMFERKFEDGDRPFRKKPFGRKFEDGDRPFHKKPFGRKFEDGDRPFEKKPFGRKFEDGDRPFEKKPFGHKFEDGDRPFHKKPFGRKFEDGDRPFEKKPFGRKFEDGDRPFEKKPFGRKFEDGDRPFHKKSFGKKRFFGVRERNDSDRPFKKHFDSSNRPSFRKRFGRGNDAE